MGNSAPQSFIHVSERAMEQEWKDREKLARKNEDLKNELEAATERIRRLEEDLRGDETSQGMRRRTAKKEVVLVARAARVEMVVQT